MSTKTISDFEAIALDHLEKVSGGAVRSSKGGSDEITAMLTQITSSIKDLAANKSSGQDPMQMILMMMMMGGMGGGGGGVVGAPAVAGPPVINVDTGISGGGGGGCRRGGKKGW
jgi:hypothetical protein